MRTEYDKKGLVEYLRGTDREIFIKSMGLTHQIYSDTNEDVSNRHIEAERLLVKAIEVFTWAIYLLLSTILKRLSIQKIALLSAPIMLFV